MNKPHDFLGTELQDLQAWHDYLTMEEDFDGAFHVIDPRHWAVMRGTGSQLLVSFHRLEELLDEDPGDFGPLQALAEDQGWSHLALYAHGETWFRSPALWAWFDDHIDSDFFEDFDNVLFYGAEMGGYAACAFAVAAPGARVLAIRPLATLDPRIAPWESRHRAARSFDFTSRFGYAPDMITGQRDVYLVHDPRHDEDAIHASLFRGKMIRHFPCPHLGAAPEVALQSMQIFATLITAAMTGRADARLWRNLWRARKTYQPWARNLAQALTEQHSRPREATALRALLQTFPQASRLEKRLALISAPLQQFTTDLP